MSSDSQRGTEKCRELMGPFEFQALSSLDRLALPRSGFQPWETQSRAKQTAHPQKRQAK